MNKCLLKDIAKFNSSSFIIKGKEYINYLDTSSITENCINNIQKLFLGKDVIPSRAKRFVKKDTIIYSSVRPNLKHFGILEHPIENMVVSTGFITLDVEDVTKYNPKYIYYNLSQQTNTDYLQNIAQTNVSSYPSINDTDLMGLKLSIVGDVTKQKCVADVLSALDDKIKLNNKINQELEKTAKDLYNYWFVQFDFPDGNKRPYKSSGGKMVYNDVLKREIPDGWEVKSIKDFCNVITGKEDANFATTNGIYPFFTCGDEILKCDKSAFEGKAILIAGNGNFNVKYYEGKFNAYQRTYVLIPTEQKYVGIMYRAMLDAVAKFTHGSNGSIVKFITKGDIENTYVIVPNNVNLLDFFNGYLSQVEFIKKQTSDLVEIRDFLLPMLMNGQISVS